MIRDRRAVAAIEFAIIAPILLTMGYSTVETVRYVRTRELFLIATSSMADLIASQPGATTGSAGTLADVCKGVLYTLTSYPSGKFAASVVSVSNANGSGAALDWESDSACATAGSTLGAAKAVTLAGSMVPNSGDSVIAVKASFAYVPAITGIIDPITFSQTVFTRPRFGVVVCSNC